MRPSDAFPPLKPPDPQKAQAELLARWKLYPLRTDIDDHLRKLGVVESSAITALWTLYEREYLYLPEPPPLEKAHLLSSERLAAADQIVRELVALLTKKTESGISLGMVPYISIAKNPRQLVSDLVFKLSASTVRDTKDLVFPHYSPIVRKNVALASGYDNDDRPGKKYVNPLKSDLPPPQLAKAYLNDTPFREILMQPVPYIVPDLARLEHFHIMRKTGGGKSSTLLHIMYQDITRPDPPALILVDPKGDMVHVLQKLTVFAENPDRLAIIDPKYAPQLNVFAAPKRKLAENTRRGIMDSYFHMFSAIDTELPAPQKIALISAIKLVLSLGGGMRLFLDVLTDPAKDITKSEFRDAMLALDEFTAKYFATQYHTGMVPTSRKSLAGKVHYLADNNEAFKRMFFTSTENTLDMFERLQTPGSVTLINCPTSQLGIDGASFFGRWAIGQVFAASNEVGGLDRRRRRTAYLIIDEAQLFFDQNIEHMLTLARSNGLGILFAHQSISQLDTEALKSAVLGMPSIRLAAPIDRDITTISRVMHTTPEFLAPLEKQKSVYAAYNTLADHEWAVKVQVPHRSVEEAPQASEEQLEALIRRNNERYSHPTPIDKNKSPPPPPKNRHLNDAD